MTIVIDKINLKHTFVTVFNFHDQVYDVIEVKTGRVFKSFESEYNAKEFIKKCQFQFYSVLNNIGR